MPNLASAPRTVTDMAVAAADVLAHRRQWRYTWETLAHLPILRLYLFHPTALSATPSDLRADLRLDASLLLLAFSLAGDPVSLRVPVPRVLVDPSAPPECRAAGDHVEVRLALVLPVDHPVVAAAFPNADQPAPLSLRGDLKGLSSGDIHLYCKACSARLTKQPLSHGPHDVLPLLVGLAEWNQSSRCIDTGGLVDLLSVHESAGGRRTEHSIRALHILNRELLLDIMEMPSLDWEDVADNWFGGCCTSFGGASEKLVSQYISAYGQLEGTTLLDATSIIIEKDYLEMDLVSSNVPASDFVALQEAMSNVSLENDHTTKKLNLNNSEDELRHRKKIGSSHVQPPVILEEGSCDSNNEKNGDDPCIVQSGTLQLENDIDVNAEKSKGDCCVEDMGKPSQEADFPLIDTCGCCYDSRDSAKVEYNNTSKMPIENWKVQTTLENHRDYKLTKNISLGSSFIIKESNLLKDVDWIELLCSYCSSTLGSYPSQSSHAPSDGRVRLFKCYTSSNLPVGGPHDVFRGHTLGKLFVNLLLEIAEDEISFRTVVRDLKTKTPVLQIVLLSSKAWLFSGYCHENDMDGSHEAAHLQPAVKLLYSNCSDASGTGLRTVEEWSSKYRAEQLYMMKLQINELTECLGTAMDKFPLSCSSLEGMCLSSLER